MSIARKEARESLYWLRLLAAADIVKEAQLAGLIKECDEIVAILTAIVKTAQKNK